MDARVLADDGCQLWTARAGHGDSLVFCHGGPGLWDTFDDLAAMFAVPDWRPRPPQKPLRPSAAAPDWRPRPPQKPLRPSAAVSIRTIRWDQRGCGRSQRVGPYSVARSVRDLDAVRHHLAGPRTALLGHSWGSHLALRYAIQHPDRVSHLIYVAGTGIDPDRPWHPDYERNLRQRLGDHLSRWETLRTRDRSEAEDRELAILQWSADFADPSTALREAERLATPWLGINYDCNAAINADVKHELDSIDMAAQCRALDLPVLIVDGSEDIRPRWAVDSLHRALPKADRVTLAGAGHLPWIEHPQAFQRAVSTFLAQPT